MTEIKRNMVERRGRETQVSFTEWPILIGGATLLGASVLMAEVLSRSMRLKKVWLALSKVFSQPRTISARLSPISCSI